MLGIIGAMPIEVEKLTQAMVGVSTCKIGQTTYFSGKLSGTACVVAFSGVGKVNAAVCAQTMILVFNVKKIVNVGVAGGLLEHMSLGDVIVATSAVQHDFDVTALGEPIGQISTINLVNLPCSSCINKKIIETLKLHKNSGVFCGVIASGDKFVAKKDELIKIREQFNAVACDMETGSIAHVCYINAVEFAAIRVISDNINNENSSLDYEKFKQKSAQIACDILTKCIDLI